MYGSEDFRNTGIKQIVVKNDDRSPSISPPDRRTEAKEEAKRNELQAYARKKKKLIQDMYH